MARVEEGVVFEEGDGEGYGVEGGCCWRGLEGEGGGRGKKVMGLRENAEEGAVVGFVFLGG